jgi:hypothetical protein
VSNKHNTYFELREAIGAPGCLVCRLAARSVRRYLEALSFESVNDYGLRGQLRRARGFCNLHAWQLLDEVRDPFGAGIIYRDVLNECRRLLERGAPAELAGEGACLACDARAGSAGRYVDVLVEHLDGELDAPLTRAGGLCWRHFGLAVARAGRGLPALARVQREAIEMVGAGSVGRSSVADGPRLPAPGVRAGSAAPRRAPDEQAADPLVALAVGLPGVHGLAIDQLEARGWGEPPGEQSAAASGRRPAGVPGAGAPAGPAEEAAAGGQCRVCAVARAAAERAARLGDEGTGALELCGPHGWLALELAGAERVGARLRPGLELLAERIAAAGPGLARARPLSLGPLSLSTPAARRARGELAVQLAPGRGCQVCEEQRAAEEAALLEGGDERLCRPHHLVAHRVGARVAAEPTLAHWRAVVADLDEYIRKNDYRFREEPRGAEQHGPWRATAAVAGARSVR